jgi:L-aspartate oxidase
VFTDAFVIGSGAAGLRAAIELSGKCEVIVASKGTLQDCATRKAQGGVAMAVESAGGVESHVADTLTSGDGLCDEETVRFVISESVERIEELAEWGAEFDRENGAIALTREGGHSAARIVHARGDATGLEVERCLLAEMEKRQGIGVMEDCFVIDLVTEGDACLGAVVCDGRGDLKVVRAGATVLATGGCGRMYRETTNPEVSTGDGLALACRAGATLCDMEFVQFHPTTLYVAGAARALISEVVRGEGGILVDKNDDRFMQKYHPDGELASRDIVSRAVLTQMRETKHTNVFLDIRHLPQELIDRRFPEIRMICTRFDIDISKDLIPVRPSAHYMIGGVQTDRCGRTGVKGLYACGEVASTGFHGANRLGSNSLLEALVMGRAVGRTVPGEMETGPSRGMKAPAAVTSVEMIEDGLDITDMRNSLRSQMNRNVGIERGGAGLEDAKQALDFWSRYVGGREFHNPRGWELQNMLTVSRLIVEAALARRESRGAHHRLDFPEKAGDWEKHITLRCTT